MALSPGIRSAKRMGTSEVLCSVKVTVLRKPMETAPKSICSGSGLGFGSGPGLRAKLG